MTEEYAEQLHNAIFALVKSALTEDELTSLRKVPQQKTAFNEAVWQIVDKHGVEGLNKDTIRGAYSLVKDHLFPDDLTALY